MARSIELWSKLGNVLLFFVNSITVDFISYNEVRYLDAPPVSIVAVSTWHVTGSRVCNLERIGIGFTELLLYFVHDSD